MTSNVFPVSYIEPCFLLSSLRLVFHIGFFSIPYSLFTAIISISLSLHLVLLAPVNSCELHNYHLVLSFLFVYSSSGLSTDVFFPNKTNINTRDGRDGSFDWRHNGDHALRQRIVYVDTLY